MKKKHKMTLGTHFNEETETLHHVSYRSIITISSWPELKAQKKIRRKPIWSDFCPELSIPAGDIEKMINRIKIPAEENGQLILPFMESPKQTKRRFRRLAELKWYATIPPETRKTVSRFYNRQWQMLNLLTRFGNAASELTFSNPALSFALASSWAFRYQPVKKSQQVTGSMFKPGVKQKQILSWLGFPGTESTRKILAKIDHHAITIPNLMQVRKSLFNRHTAKIMAHLPRINNDTLKIITNPEIVEFATPFFLEEVAIGKYEVNFTSPASMIDKCLTRYQMQYPGEKNLKPFRNLSELNSIYQVLNDDDDKFSGLINNHLKFPPPPFTGSETIKPIINAWELVKEGRNQHNCVANYVTSVAKDKNCYFYQVLKPERCTMRLKLKQKNLWVLSEMLKKSNKPSSYPTWKSVEQWLADNNIQTLGPQSSIPVIGL